MNGKKQVWEWVKTGAVKNWIVVGWFLAILMEPNWYQIQRTPRFCRWFQGVTRYPTSMPCHAPKRRRICRTRDSRASPHLWRKNRWTKRQPLELRGPVASFCWTTFPMVFFGILLICIYVYVLLGGKGRTNNLKRSSPWLNWCTEELPRAVDSTVDASNWHACSGSNALL